MVSITVVNPRATRRATISSSRAKASALAAMSSSPAPTTARSRSLDTIASGGKCSAAQLDFPAPVGPTSTSRQGAGSCTATPVGGEPVVGTATGQGRPVEP
jgi:hypothetical protein